MKRVPLYEKYAETKAIGTYCVCNWGGVEVLDVIHGVNEYLVTCYNYGSGRYCFHKNLIHYNPSDGRDYIIKGKMKIFLDEIMRV